MKNLIKPIVLLLFMSFSIQAQTLSLKDIYNFSEGSVFKYEISRMSESGFGNKKIEVFTIKNKYWVNDTLHYTRIGQGENYEVFRDDVAENASPYEINEEVILVDSLSHFLNLQKGEYGKPRKDFSEHSKELFIQMTQEDGVTKKYTGASYFDPVSNQMENSDETFFHCEYQKGVGLKYETETYFNMFSTSKRLLGFVINGESFGDISTNDIVTSSETLTAAPSFAIYPTVVKSGTVVNINCNEAVKTIYLSSVSGQMTEVRVKSGNYFSFPNLPSGIYLLGIKIKGEWAFKRIINN